MKRTTLSERGLVLAPNGRDSAVASAMLAEAGIEALACGSLTCLIDELDKGAGFVVVTEESLSSNDLHPLAEWLAAQEEWSDLPFVLLTVRGGGLERNPAARRYLEILGNVTFLERPFHPTTLVSLAQSALRGRRRQYEARSRLEALRASENRYRTLFDSMDEGFAVVEFPPGRFDTYIHVEVNAAYERHAGLTNIVGKWVREVVGEEADDWIRILGEVARTGEPLRFERELEATGRYLDLSAFRLEPASRNQVAILFQDVTARRIYETSLRELNETLERRVAEALAERRVLADIVEGTDAFVIVVDNDFQIMAVNRAAADEFQRIFGVRPRAGQNLLRLLDDQPEQQAEVAAAWSRALAGDAYVEVQQFGNPSLDRRSYELKFNVLRDSQGRQIGAYQFVYDVTERLRDQQRLAEATAQMHEMAKLETLGQLTGGVAHDFNNLLTPITGALDILSRGEAGRDPRAARLIGGALQSAERAKTLVQRLLGFARRQALQPRATDLSKLILDMRDLIASSTGAGIQLRLLTPPGLPPARVDPNQLELAVLNLAVNARDAMPAGGLLTVGVERASSRDAGAPTLAAGDYLRLYVSDTGMGMDESTLARAIEPFFSTKEMGRGTGLGLSMVHGLAAQLGGAFALDSTPGEGTRAQIYLPVAEGAVEAPPAPAEAVDTENFRELSILLVDDEELVRAGTAEMLREIGHAVTEAGSGAEALDRFGDGSRFDLVVTDFTMPRMDGGELARRIRARKADTPVLVITGYAGGDLDLDLPHLAKPFRQNDLAAILPRVLEAAG